MTPIARTFHKRLPWAPADLPKIVALGVAQAGSIGATVLLVWAVFQALPAARQDPMSAAIPLAGLAAAVVVSAWLRSFEFIVTENIGFQMVRRLRMAIYQHMSGMAPRQIQHRSRGSLILRLTGDLTMLRTWVSRGIARAIIGAIIVAACSTALIYLDIRLAGAAIAVFAAGFLVSYLWGLRMNRATRRVRRRRSLLTSNVDEQVNALAVIQMFGRTRGEYARLSRQNDALTSALVIEARLRGALRGLSSGTGWLAMVAVLAVGALEMPQGESLGIIAAALTAVRYMNGSVRSLAFAHEYWRRAQVSRAKITDFFKSSSRDLEAPGELRLGTGGASLEFRNVSVEGALRPFSARIEKGQRIAIVGAAGAGKSTLLALAARLAEPDSGEIRVGDVPLNDFSRLSTFRTIGMVSPDLPLLRGTVRRNLTYRRSSAPRDDLAWLYNAASLDVLLEQLPEGLDTWVTEGGGNLSVGQRQHMALARAMFGNPPLLVLDEPSSGMDGHGKALVREVISRHQGTVLIATHDPREAELADHVWFLDNGRLSGTMSGDDYREYCRVRRQSIRREAASAAPVFEPQT